MNSRTKRLEELATLKELSDGQFEWIKENYKKYNNFIDLLKGCCKTKKEGGGCHDHRGVTKLTSLIKTLENPPYSMEDTVNRIVDWESELLGISLSCSRIDQKNTDDVNCTCKEFIEGKKLDNYTLAGEVKAFRAVKVKNGKNAGSEMAFLTIDDGSCIMGDVACFSETWETSKDKITEGAMLLFDGIRDKKNGGFILNKVYEL